MKLTVKQTIALDLLENNVITEEVFGGGAGGGKSVLGCHWLIKNCLKYPQTRWVMGRAKLKTLKETTLNTFFEVAKTHNLEINKHFKLNNVSHIIHFYNGSEILLKDLFYYPSDPNFDELGSLEITGAFVDEANQITAKAKQILKSRIRYKLDCYGLIPKILYTCNPAKNWVYSEFFRPAKEGTLEQSKAFVQSLVDDNAFISKHYKENLLTLDAISKERLLYGNWEFDDDPCKLIEYDNILNVFTNDFIKHGVLSYITCDAARYGSDKAVIMVWKGLVIVEIFEFAKCSTLEIQKKINEFRIKYTVPLLNIIVDSDGVGGGIVDNLNCRGFINNAKPVFDKKNRGFANIKSQCYFELADYINQNKIYCQVQRYKNEIVKELETVKKDKVDSDGKLHIISKDKVRELIGRSPDYADSMMMRMYFELKGNVMATV